MTEDIIEAVARAITAHFVENTGFITVNEDDEKTTVSAHYGTWIDLRVYPIARAAIAAYEAARGDVVMPSFQDGLEAAAQYLEMCDDYGDRLKAHEIRALAASQGER